MRRYASVYIIDVRGDMDLYNAHELKNIVDRLLENGVGLFVVNLENVEYIDSSGVGALIHVYSAVKQRNLRLKIANVHGSVEKVIRLTKLLEYFPIAEDVRAAVKELASPG